MQSPSNSFQNQKFDDQYFFPKKSRNHFEDAGSCLTRFYSAPKEFVFHRRLNASTLLCGDGRCHCLCSIAQLTHQPMSGAVPAHFLFVLEKLFEVQLHSQLEVLVLKI